jgi:hypothetical protein
MQRGKRRIRQAQIALPALQQTPPINLMLNTFDHYRR